MKLLYQTHSPYARKALVFAHEVGLADRIEVIHHETSPTLRNAVVFAENPLGKVPVLIRPGLAAIFDSDVICAYLDTLHEGRKLIPAEGEARWQALRIQAVSQGLADAGIAVRWETVRRPEQSAPSAAARRLRREAGRELRLAGEGAGHHLEHPCRAHRARHRSRLAGVS